VASRLSSVDALMSVELRTSPVALVITLWDILNIAITILNVLERMRMAAASHELLHALGLSTGVIGAVALQQVHNDPNAKASA